MQETDQKAFEHPILTPAPRVLLVIAPFYAAITSGLLDGAETVLSKVGAAFDVAEVPGALEIGPAIAIAAGSGRYEGYVALGCVMRGETSHYETVCAESARALTYLSVQRGLMIGNGVLTVDTRAQAVVRADPNRMDKGGAATIACLQLIALARRFQAAPAPSAEGEILMA
ncbi:MAG: 6,7-dimethyl-8-ribityllumazine synthase [Pseudomonadota bacterium]